MFSLDMTHLTVAVGTREIDRPCLSQIFPAFLSQLVTEACEGAMGEVILFKGSVRNDRHSYTGRTLKHDKVISPQAKKRKDFSEPRECKK